MDIEELLSLIFCAFLLTFLLVKCFTGAMNDKHYVECIKAGSDPIACHQEIYPRQK